LAIPLGEAPGLAPVQELILVVTVIRDHDAAEPGIAGLEVYEGQAEFLSQVIQLPDLEGTDVQLEELAFHAQHVDQVLRSVRWS